MRTSDKMYMVSILSALILLLIANRCSCCSCGLPHIQDSFCEADIVLRGKALSRNDPAKPGDSVVEYWTRKITYDVEITDLFKVPNMTNIKVGDTIKAVTPGHDGLCGGYIRLDKDTLITGKLNELGQLSFDQCSYQERFNRLTKFEVEGIKGAYTCGCSVVWYSWQYDSYENCRMTVGSGYRLRCLSHHGRCIRNGEYECEWDVDKSEVDICKEL